ncbi:outer membrane beta-barrel protein [Shewanella algae]|uniref:outer membrane beta-barrel protein n=1 Tax=Shewanella algae TaxID=38313 RepID=UPI001AAF7A1E|nr:outer membrane beta-barrel protein [Shewanella algae]EJG0043428.1 outer membrane beta-barrel protein [Vibrio parahaemolyticus]MBO2597435.1 outer membrane beta-barrel protein [Shewanella algae]
MKNIKIIFISIFLLQFSCYSNAGNTKAAQPENVTLQKQEVDKAIVGTTLLATPGAEEANTVATEVTQDVTEVTQDVTEVTQDELVLTNSDTEVVDVVVKTSSKAETENVVSTMSESTFEPIKNYDYAGFYLGSKAGVSVSSTQCSGTECSSFNSPYYSILMGYLFNEWGGVQLEHSTILDKSSNITNTQSSLLMYGVNYIKPFYFDNHHLFFTAGVKSWQQQLTSLNGSRQVNSISPSVGLGYGYDIPNTNLSVNLGYEFINAIGGTKTNEHIYGLGFKYKFNAPQVKIVQPKTPKIIIVEKKIKPEIIVKDKPFPTNVSICFESDSASLNRYTKHKLNSLYKALDVYQHIKVVGFADRHGSLDYNINLVQSRIDTIIEYLKSEAMKGDSLIEFSAVNASNINLVYSDDKRNRCAELLITDAVEQ